MVEPRIIALKEYEQKQLPAADFPNELGELLYRNYGIQVEVEFPSFPTGYQWQLTSQGWVGYIPLSEDLHLILEPKVELGNLFEMLDYAYNLDIIWLEELFKCSSLQDYYDRLASILSKRVLSRSRKGFYREYLPYQEDLPFLRERIMIGELVRRPWRVEITCSYHEHTPDISDNQILAWTLYSIGRSGMCTPKTNNLVRQAYHQLYGNVTLVPHRPNDCIRRLYQRLNEDYHPMHAMCRFFLEQSGPSHKLGYRTMIPFLVDMGRLFELFVAEWLNKHLQPPWKLKVQEKVPLAESSLFFRIDLVLEDLRTGEVQCVLDTKYKAPTAPAESDIMQVVTYAETKGCQDAILIYPKQLENDIDIQVGRIRVRSMCFDISDNLEQAGLEFIRHLGVFV